MSPEREERIAYHKRRMLDMQEKLEAGPWAPQVRSSLQAEIGRAGSAISRIEMHQRRDDEIAGRLGNRIKRMFRGWPRTKTIMQTLALVIATTYALSDNRDMALAYIWIGYAFHTMQGKD